MKKYLISFAHYLIILLALSLPFLLDWKLVALIMVLYYLVFTRGLGYCPLTVWQFGSAEEGFIEKHFIALFRFFSIPIPNRKNLKTFIRYGLPILLILTAFIRQTLR